METVLSKLLGKQVKALFSDNGKTKIIIGTLNEVTENYIVVEDVVIGLGSNFISCIPQENNRRMF